MKNILTILAFLYALSPIYAQLIERSPCTAICIDPNGKITGRQPNQNNVSPNLNNPCGSLNVSEDNPTWWIVRPLGNSLTFSITTSNCIAGECGLIGVELTLWEGDNCGSLTPVACIVGTSGTLTSPVSACKIYYLQLDGLCESQCNIILTYDKNQILKSTQKPYIVGTNQTCLNKTFKYTAYLPGLIGCEKIKFKWTTIPEGISIITPVVGESNSVNILLNSVPLDGRFKLCARPQISDRCPPPVQQACFDIDVNSCCACN